MAIRNEEGRIVEVIVKKRKWKSVDKPTNDRRDAARHYGVTLGTINAWCEQIEQIRNM